MKIFDWQDVPMIGQNVYDVYDVLFTAPKKQVWKHKITTSLWTLKF